MRTLREAIESHGRVLIQYTLRHGWTVGTMSAPYEAWRERAHRPTLWDALGDCFVTANEQRAIDTSLITEPVVRISPADWPDGDNWTPPPEEKCDYGVTWEWWSPAYRELRKSKIGWDMAPDGWFRGRIDWTSDREQIGAVSAY